MNGVIVIASLVGDSDFFGITVLWSIYLAFKYAKLWADGYDWRDVFRQPRDRDLIDVADDSLTYVRAMFDRNQRQAMREQRRARLGSRTHAAGDGAAARLDRCLGRRRHRRGGELRRSCSPRRDGSRRGAATARAHAVGGALAHSRRRPLGGRAGREGQVSRARAVRPRAYCVRERRATRSKRRSRDSKTRRIRWTKAAATSACGAWRFSSASGARVADVVTRRDAVAAKLETCVVALQNIKLDLIRLNAGSQTPQHITSLAMDALNLADSVDSALYVADEMRNTGTRPASRQAAR